MTSCQEECPITTGALLRVRDALAAANVLDKVAIVEVSVDPSRDDAARLGAYAKNFDIPFTLLSGSATNLEKFWGYFGAISERVKEGTPPDIDWESGKPYTFDIAHSDNTFVLNDEGNEAALVEGNANVSGQLPKKLAALLSDEGQSDLTNPGLGSWTPGDLLQTVGAVLGQAIPGGN
jgi:protein SCO1/2